LGEQRRLAVARGRLDEDDGPVAEGLARRLEALPRQLVARNPRRRDLEEEVVGGARVLCVWSGQVVCGKRPLELRTLQRAPAMVPLGGRRVAPPRAG